MKEEALDRILRRIALQDVMDLSSNYDNFIDSFYTVKSLHDNVSVNSNGCARVVALFEALYMHFLGESEKTDIPPSRWAVCWLEFDYLTSNTGKGC